MGIFTDVEDIERLKVRCNVLDTKMGVLNTQLDEITDDLIPVLQKEIAMLKAQNKVWALHCYKDIYGYQKAKGKHYVIALDTPEDEIDLISKLLCNSFKIGYGLAITANFPYKKENKILTLSVIPQGASYSISILSGEVLCLSAIIEACEKYEKEHKKCTK